MFLQEVMLLLNLFYEIQLEIVTYNGDSELRKVAVDEGSYREEGINGIDAFFYVANSALKRALL